MGRSLAWTVLAVSLTFTLLIISVGSQQGSGQQGCPVPPITFGTNHSGQGTAVFRPYATITYTCSFGFIRTGNGNRICQVDGTWTGTDDVCMIDSSSLSLACVFGAMALVISGGSYFWLIKRSRTKRRRMRANRLTITGNQPAAEADPGNKAAAEAEEGGQDNMAGPDDDSEEGSAPTKDSLQHPAADRSDSGLPTDTEMGAIDLAVFDMEEDQWT